MLKNFLSANGMFTFAVSGIVTTNVAFAIEGNSPVPEYFWTLMKVMDYELAFWIITGIIYLIWRYRQKMHRGRRLGILRYDGQRREWYYDAR